jgi:hypothetical protein
MTPTGLVILLIAAPVFLLTVLRVNAAMVFLSLCLGQVLVTFVGTDAASTVGILASDGSTNPSVVSLCLLLIPAVFTTLIMMRTIKGKFKLILNVLPAISVGVLMLLLVEPLLSPGLQAAVESTDAWYLITKLQAFVVGVSAIISIFFLWLQRPKHHKEDKHHK